MTLRRGRGCPVGLMVDVLYRRPGFEPPLSCPAQWVEIPYCHYLVTLTSCLSLHVDLWLNPGNFPSISLSSLCVSKLTCILRCALLDTLSTATVPLKRISVIRGVGLRGTFGKKYISFEIWLDCDGEVGGVTVFTFSKQRSVVKVWEALLCKTTHRGDCYTACGFCNCFILNP